MEETLVACAIWLCVSLVFNFFCVLLLLAWNKKVQPAAWGAPLPYSIALSAMRMAGIFYLIANFTLVKSGSTTLLVLACLDLVLLFGISRIAASQYGSKSFFVRYTDGHFIGSILFAICFLQTYAFR